MCPFLVHTLSFCSPVFYLLLSYLLQMIPVYEFIWYELMNMSSRFLSMHLKSSAFLMWSVHGVLSMRHPMQWITKQYILWRNIKGMPLLWVASTSKSGTIFNAKWLVSLRCLKLYPTAKTGTNPLKADLFMRTLREPVVKPLKTDFLMRAAADSDFYCNIV